MRMQRLQLTAPIFILAMSPPAIALIVLASILYGARDISAVTVWEAFFHFDPDNVSHQIVIHSRLPRAIGALLIGAFLAVSGAVMQGVTRNYLASPSIMGVSDGSVFVVTLCMIFMPGVSSLGLILCSFVGSALGAGLAFGLAALLPGGMTPVRMAIIGTVIGTFLSSFSAALSTYFQISQNISFWYNARLHQIDPDMIRLSIPFAVAAILLTLWISKSITVMSMGEDIAMSLGQRTVFVKVAATASVVILTGISVALAGKIGFIGLIVPHITRFLTGLDYRWTIPCAGVLGAIFLALSDVVSRFVNAPFETPIGVVTSMIGVPFFLYLIYKKGGENNG